MTHDEFTALFKAAMIRFGFAVLEHFFDWAVDGGRISRERADEVLADWAAIAECRIVALGVPA